MAALKISHRNNLVSVNFKTLLSENNLTMLQIKTSVSTVHNHILAEHNMFSLSGLKEENEEKMLQIKHLLNIIVLSD